MLAANAELDASGRVARPRSAASSINSPTPSTSMLTNGSLRVDALLDISAEEAAGIVAADAERGLRQIVGAEREELALPRRCSPALSAARGSSIIVPTR